MSIGPAVRSAWVVAVAFATATDELSRDDVLADLDALSARIEASFAYADDKHEHFGVDVRALCSAAAAALPERPTRRDALAAVTSVVAGLKDGHAYASMPKTSLLPAHVLPLSFCDTTDGPAIHHVSPHVPETVDVRRGDVVVSIDGEPIEPRVARLTAIAFGSTPGQRRSLALAFARHVDERTSVLELDRAERGRFTVEVPADLPYFLPPRATRRVETTFLDDGAIAAMRIDSFALADADAWSKATTPAERDALLDADRALLREAFAAIAGARGLVLDLRGNPGGTDLLGHELVRHLVAAPFTYYDLSGYENGSPTQRFPVRVEPAEGVVRFEGPLVVLIDERSFSVTDNVCAALRDLHHDVLFVGRPTGGGTGAPRPFVLPRTGATVTFCTMLVWSPSGELIEGRGTLPDVPVTNTARDVAEGFDRALDVAVRALK